MEESSTIRAFIEEGRVKGMARKIILRLGRIRFGAVDETSCPGSTRSRTSNSSNA